MVAVRIPFQETGLTTSVWAAGKRCDGLPSAESYRDDQPATADTAAAEELRCEFTLSNADVTAAVQLRNKPSASSQGRKFKYHFTKGRFGANHLFAFRYLLHFLKQNPLEVCTTLTIRNAHSHNK